MAGHNREEARSKSTFYRSGHGHTGWRRRRRMETALGADTRAHPTLNERHHNDRTHNTIPTTTTFPGIGRLHGKHGPTDIHQDTHRRTGRAYAPTGIARRKSSSRVVRVATPRYRRERWFSGVLWGEYRCWLSSMLCGGRALVVSVLPLTYGGREARGKLPRARLPTGGCGNGLCNQYVDRCCRGRKF